MLECEDEEGGSVGRGVKEKIGAKRRMRTVRFISGRAELKQAWEGAPSYNFCPAVCCPPQAASGGRALSFMLGKEPIMRRKSKIFISFLRLLLPWHGGTCRYLESTSADKL